MRIFMTGGSGFLGTVLMHHLISRGHVVTALVRKANGQSPEDRLKHRLHDYDPAFSWNETNGKTLFAVEGDASRTRFGLDLKNYLSLATDADVILHNAACTALETDWNVYEQVNIGGTREAVQFAYLTRRKSIVYVSSAYVAGEQTGTVSEEQLHLAGSFRNRYERSKAIAENDVRKASSSGRIRSLIVRPSIIVGDSKTGWMCPEHHFYDLIHRLLCIRRILHKRARVPGVKVNARFRIPGNPETTKNFVPVDHASRLICSLMETDAAWDKSFHVTNPHPAALKTLAAYVQNAMDWPDLGWCEKEKITDLSPLEKRFLRSIRIYEKYFWQEPVFNQAQIKSVLGEKLSEPDLFSQDIVKRMVNFVKLKHVKSPRSKQPQAV